MRLNEDTVLRLSGSDVVLVPYNKSHVKTYHEWMGDEELLRLTCSERLTLEEEYENQQSWRADEKKLTFIIVDAHRNNAMAGDVNLYLNGDEEAAEIEIMIADKLSRRRGLAGAALSLMITYATEHLSVCTFVAKVLQDNKPSLALFGKLGFQFLRTVSAFGETHLNLSTQNGVGEALVRDTREKWLSESYTGNKMLNPSAEPQSM